MTSIKDINDPKNYYTQNKIYAVCGIIGASFRKEDGLIVVSNSEHTVFYLNLGEKAYPWTPVSRETAQKFALENGIKF